MDSACSGDALTDSFPPIYGGIDGIVTDREIHAVLDASGFAYGYQWGPGPTMEAAARFNFWKKQGKKIILLPQAFGPFTSREIDRSFRTIADNADLIYARDKISYRYVVNLVGERPNLKIAPDFTNLLASEPPTGFGSGEKRFAIVPNFRMIEKTSEADRGRYMPFLAICVRHLLHKGFHPRSSDSRRRGRLETWALFGACVRI